MCDVICLSSDEEDEAPRSKRIKLTRVESPKTLAAPISSDNIILSSDDDASQNGVDKIQVVKVVTDDFITENPIDETISLPQEFAVVNEALENLLETAKSNEEEVHVLSTEVGDGEEQVDDPILSETDVTFQSFCDKCRKYIENLPEKEMLKSRLDSLLKLYNKLKNYNKLEEFDKFLREKLEGAEENSSLIIVFHAIFKWAFDTYSAERKSEKKVQKSITKLTETLQLLSKKVQKLRDAEVDLDDEDENSAYIKGDAYERRFVQVHKKLCELMNCDPNEGRVTYSSLNFRHSRNSLLNKAINRKYSNSNNLPDFYEFNKFLRKVISKAGINMSEEKIKEEARSCFEHLTKLVKKNRQRELYEVQNHIVEGLPDETARDSNFTAKIKENRIESRQKMDDIILKYVHLQETGHQPSVSSDSDDSNKNETEDSE